MSEGGVMLLLRQAEQEIRSRIQPFLDAEQLSYEHWQVLAVLKAAPGLRMSEIAETAVLPAATLTRHMDRLVERALVVRRIDAEDKRRVVAALSSHGEALVARLGHVVSDAEAALPSALGAARVEALLRELTYSASPE